MRHGKGISIKEPNAHTHRVSAKSRIDSRRNPKFVFLFDYLPRVPYTYLMSKRLQVILDDGDMRAIRTIAKRRRMSVAEWVRQVLRSARREEPTSDPRRKLDVLHSAVRHTFPSGDIQQMSAEIERG